MEVYAGFLEHTDHHVGRLIDALGDLEILDDTLVSTSSATTAPRPREPSTAASTSASCSTAPSRLETPEFVAARIDEFGTPTAYNHYAVGWAHAMDTPYQWTKQVASHWGGTRNGTIVHWPNGIKAKGEIRAPVPPCDRHRPDRPRRGRAARADVRQRRPADAAPWRVSMAYSFDDADGGRAARDPVLRDVRATAASTTRAGRP